MEKLSAMWGKFSLSESEENKFQVQDDLFGEEFLLAARFFTVRAINIEAIGRTLKLLWRTKKGFEVRDMGNHRVLFIFSDEMDLDWVLKGEPWSFDKHLVALKRVEKTVNIQEVTFDSTRFWIQIHDLPIRSSSLTVAKEIVSLAGVVDEGETEGEDPENYNFVRVRVAVDITKPLCRGRKISTTSGREGWVNFRYERLPNICYGCGRLTHSDRECLAWTKNKELLRTEVRQFGPWLRALTPHPFKKSVIRVEGYEEDSTPVANSDRSDASVEDQRDKARTIDTHAEEIGQHGGEREAVDREAESLGPTVVQRTHLAATGITEVTAQNNEVFNEINHSADFQAQLEEIDSELARYDNKGDPLHGHLAGREDVDLHGPELMGLQSSGGINGPIFIEKEAGLIGPAKGKATYKPRGLPRVDKGLPQRESILAKRSVRDFYEDEEAGVHGKKKKTEATDAETVEAGSQPRRAQ